MVFKISAVWAFSVCISATALAADVQRPGFEALMTRVECTVWARDRMEDLWTQHKAQARDRGDALWTKDAHELVATSSALEAYMARHVFTWMDPETYWVVVDAHWPEGTEATPERADKCVGFLNRHYLRYVRNPDDGYSNWTR